MANFTNSKKQVTSEPADLALVLDCGVLPVLAATGAAGNCLCAAVFLRQRYRPVASPLLLALCLSDTVFLLCTLLVRLACLVGKVDRQTGATYRVFMTPQVDVLRNVMAHVTVLLTSALGVERCVAVTRPFKLRALCTSGRVRTAALVLCGAVLAAMTPAFFQQDVVQHRLPNDDDDDDYDDNATVVYRLHDTAFYHRNRATLDFYLRFVLPLLLRALPFVGTWVCLAIIFLSFRRRLRLRTRPQRPAGHRASCERSNTADNADLVLEEKNVTRACVVLLTVYVTSELPGLAFSLVKMVRRDLRNAFHHDHVMETVYNVASLSEVVNSAINFLVFLIMYKHFCVAFGKLTTLCRV